MPLLKSPTGLLKPYTREGVTTLFRQTATGMATMEKAAQEMQKMRRLMDKKDLSEEDAVRLLRRIKYLSKVAAKHSAEVDAKLVVAAGRVEKYLEEAEHAFN